MISGLADSISACKRASKYFPRDTRDCRTFPILARNFYAMKKLLAIIAIAVAAYVGFVPKGSAPPGEVASTASRSDEALADAFENRKSNLQIEGAGKVVRILPDDTDGDRHQRFLLDLDSGQTLLVAHNIDVAPRIAALKRGDTVAFYGEYEWNSKGGVIHWTHRDPDGRHPGGWIKHGGRIYQ